jgi:hypothetical protein
VLILPARTLLACATPDAVTTPAGPGAAETAANPDAAPAATALPAHREFPNAAAAVTAILARNPRVLGIGEVHATTDGPAVPTTMSRFTSQILPVLAPRTTDLVLETWHLDPSCRKPAEHVATQVQADTKRPEETKDDLSELIDASKKLGVQPHDLVIACDEYPKVLDGDGNVVYGSLLSLVTGKLADYAERGFSTTGAALVIYGGAVHNDVSPSADLAAYSYGVPARAKGGDGYVELDLYVPELIRASPSLIEPAWAPLLDATGPDRVLLYERSPGSYVLLLETTPGAPAAAGSAAP